MSLSLQLGNEDEWFEDIKDQEYMGTGSVSVGLSPQTTDTLLPSFAGKHNKSTYMCWKMTGVCRVHHDIFSPQPYKSEPAQQTSNHLIQDSIMMWKPTK